MTADLPTRLKSDAIVEVVLDIRFDSDAATIPELYVGKLADYASWSAFKQVRLPSADIPAPMRDMNPDLKYQPTIELTDPNGRWTIRIGPHNISTMHKGKYPGWDEIGLIFKSVANHLFSVIRDIKISRLGMRYINILRSDIHEISGISDLDLSIKIANSDIDRGLNLNWQKKIDDDLEGMLRVSSIDLVKGAIPENASFMVDIDMYTTDRHGVQRQSSVDGWIDRAHDEEKKIFFDVLGRETTERLREK